MIKKIIITTLLPALLLLAACSPHPGTGAWGAAKGNQVERSSEFARIDVTYEGRANIYGWLADPASDSDATAIRRCFWSGVDKKTIALNCVQAVNTEIEETYMLRVDADDRGSVLLQDGRPVTRFLRGVAAN